MKKIVFILLLVANTRQTIGQIQDSLSYPEVNQSMPEISIRNIKYYFKDKATLKDFQGKWLLLDFWNKHCAACVANFPMLNQIQKELGDKIQVMLIGIGDEKGDIEKMYAKFRERLDLEMPCAFDSMVAKRLDINTGPHSILIDDKGIVQCVTLTFSKDDVQGFLSGKSPSLPKTYRRDSEKVPVLYTFDRDKAFLINSNGGNDSDFLFRSILSVWNGENSYLPDNVISNSNKGKFQALGAPLEWLYNYAYFGHQIASSETSEYGKYFAHPILEVKDSSKFLYSFKYNKNLYSYSLIMPPSICTEGSMKAALQKDLAIYFGYDASIELKNCPCWKLVVVGGNAKKKLVSKGGKSEMNQLTFRGAVTFRNWPFSKFMKLFSYWQQQEIILDETGIMGNVDLTLDCIPTNFDDLLKGLRNIGLDLVQSEKPMNVVVIRDAAKK